MVSLIRLQGDLLARLHFLTLQLLNLTSKHLLRISSGVDAVGLREGGERGMEEHLSYRKLWLLSTPRC